MMRCSRMFRCLILLWVGLVLVAHAVSGSSSRDFKSFLKMPINRNEEESSSGYGAKWAVLVAGSSGYWNYRHQADVCHAYQILKKGGLKDENIVVFMYDDIATNGENPRPGTIINHPKGSDVYSGVPKDYTGQDVNVDNFLAVILGDKSKVKGGSGKVVSSGPNDHIFIYYSDHGGAGVLGMPLPPYLYASDFISTLKQKHAAKGYKEMVIYIEACESGSILEGLLPKSLNIYATTASNAVENSWGTYCPGMNPPPPPEFDTCLGDLYSVSWMEDSEVKDLERETIAQQYELVKYRTSNRNTYKSGSHVMQYGNITINKEELSLYMGSNPENSRPNSIPINGLSPDVQSMAINQRDADVLYMWQKYAKAKENSLEKFDAQKKLLDTMTHRMHLDKSVELLGNLLFGSERGSAVLKAVRPSGMPLVDDWDCLKKMVRIFEMHCGYLLQYGMKHMRAFANICNADITEDAMASACKEACYHISSNPWSSLPRGGFSS